VKHRLPRRTRLVRHAVVPVAFALSVATTLAWAWTGGVDQFADPTVAGPPPPSPGPILARVEPTPTPTAAATSIRPRTVVTEATTGVKLTTRPARRGCELGWKLVPTCGVLWGAAAGAHTDSRGAHALAKFERKTGRTQAIYHAYHGGIRQLFPTPEEIAIARQPGRNRVLLINWKPESATWAKIARGDRRTDKYLDRLAAHIRKTYPERFFLAIHHEGENEVRERSGSGYTARDYAAMYRHVVERLRARGSKLTRYRPETRVRLMANRASKRIG